LTVEVVEKAATEHRYRAWAHGGGVTGSSPVLTAAEKTISLKVTQRESRRPLAGGSARRVRHCRGAWSST
jgi:glycine/D-amino acid oxidase-like deaminating enzyme